MTFNSCMQSKKEREKKYSNITPLYLGLFIHIPGEGDGIVGDFFNIPDCVEALLVISCLIKTVHSLFLANTNFKFIPSYQASTQQIGQ